MQRLYVIWLRDLGLIVAGMGWGALLAWHFQPQLAALTWRPFIYAISVGSAVSAICIMWLKKQKSSD
jgi:hypothetical protein